MTTSEFPAAMRRRKAVRSLATSSKCSPVVGSSKRKSRVRAVATGGWSAAATTSAGRLGSIFTEPPPTSTRCPASFRRCASPPESVGTGWPSRR